MRVCLLLFFFLLVSCKDKVVDFDYEVEVSFSDRISTRLIEDGTSGEKDYKECFRRMCDRLYFSIDSSRFDSIDEVTYFFVHVLFRDTMTLYQEEIQNISGYLIAKDQNRDLPKVYVAHIVFKSPEAAQIWFYHIITSTDSYRVLRRRTYHHVVLLNNTVIVCRGFGNNDKEKQGFADEIIKLVEECVSCSGMKGLRMSDDTNKADSLSGCPDSPVCE